jgi:hypothetical protein
VETFPPGGALVTSMRRRQLAAGPERGEGP